MQPANESQTVTVIGLGAMGTALATALLKNGRKVVVWNRTPSKCQPLKELGAKVAESVAEAAQIGEVIIISLSNYPASRILIRPRDVSAALRGKTLVQLTTGAKQDARTEEIWAEENSISYVDGTIPAYPKDIGQPHCAIFYSGKKESFEAAMSTLKCFGGHPLFVGADVGASAVLDMALVGSVAAGAMLAFLHGAAICQSEGICLNTYLSIALEHVMPRLVRDNMEISIEMIRNGSYKGTQATLDTWHAGISHFIPEYKEMGVDVSYPEAVLHYLAQAQSMGHGQNELASVFECFKSRR